MWKLYLDFASALTNGFKANKKNYFNDISLYEQFKLLKYKYDLPFESFEEMIEEYLTINKHEEIDEDDYNSYDEDAEQDYFLSFPSYVRRAHEESNRRIFNNLVIRIEKDNLEPIGYDMILIGDVQINTIYKQRLTYCSIKGVEFISSGITKYEEKHVYAVPAYTFEMNGKRADFHGERGDSLLDEHFLQRILQDYRPLDYNKYDQAMGIYKEWSSYLEFRRGILRSHSNTHKWNLKYVDVIDVYEINKNDYREEWAELRINKKANYLTDTYILLDKVEGSKKTSMVYVEIDNKNSQLRDIRKKTNPREYPMKLVFSGWQLEEGARSEEVELGDRFYIEEEKVSPNLTKIEQKYNLLRMENRAEKERQYKTKIERELKQILSNERETIKEDLLKEDTADNKIDLLNIDKTIFNYLDEKIKDEILLKIKKFEIQLENIEKTYNIQSRKHFGKRLMELSENKERQLLSVKKQRESVILEIFEKYNIVPEEVKIIKKLNQKMGEIEAENRRKLEVMYKEELERIIEQSLEKINIEEKEEKEKKMIEETVFRTKLYFMAEDYQGHTVSKAKIDKGRNNYRESILMYNSKREEVKINRQTQALEDFFGGVLKNPFLPLQMLSPEVIDAREHSVDGEIEWFSSELNAKQRNAIRLALKSDGVFLLQGPPGTGKTQVIAELTAQLAKSGKKVAISSETHKAIENVFSRLKKVPEIRAVRLSKGGNNSDYRPEMLLNNFYEGIISRLEKRAKRLENPEEHLKEFTHSVKNLDEIYEEYNILKDKKVSFDVEIERLLLESKEIEAEIKECKEKKKEKLHKIAVNNKAIEYINRCELEGDIECAGLLEKFENVILEVVFSNPIFGQVEKSNLSYLYTCSLEEIQRDLDSVKVNADEALLSEKHKEYKKRKGEITDYLTEEAMEGYEEEYDDLSIKIKNCGIQLKALREKMKDISQVSLVKVVGEANLKKPGVVANFINELLQFRQDIEKIIKSCSAPIKASITNINKKIDEIDAVIAIKEQERKNKLIRIDEIKKSEDVSGFLNSEAKLKNIIYEIMKEFVDSKDYAGIEDGVDKIKKEFQHVKASHKDMLNEAETKIPIYKKVCDYLKDDELREEDKERYIKELYERTNVYGFTSSSGKEGYADLSDYGVDNINIQGAGIDVVIIDEVSKSAFIDLLVPILYGKSVIFVGDHRQLPPVYPLKHMKKEDFEKLGYNDCDVCLEENADYTDLYERSYFKSLFEKVPDDRRESLLRQFRCHSHIMSVFNHFYGGAVAGLQLGTENQDEEKSHYASIRLNGKDIIAPSKHVYFVDCSGHESSSDDSTSLKNEQEAEVIVKLLELLNKEYGNLLKIGQIKKPLSAGVICTYGLQVGEIKGRCKGKKFGNFDNSRDERLMFDTVDNFQGDERDIIFVSMVRNPEKGVSTADFIKQFERINVALSRARCLLVVVGSRSFLSKCKINLPDMYGNVKNNKINYPIYKEIIETIDKIEVNNKKVLLSAEDILGGRNEEY